MITKKHKKSGAALFMYAVIAVTAVTSLICLGIYYGGITDNGSVLWTGIVAFMIMYHLWLRIIMGNVSKLIKINRSSCFFKEKPFEKTLYEFLRVKKWKGKTLTYNPEAFSLKKHTLDEIADVMAKSEADHWINEIISLTSILFSLIWGQLPIFVITALAAMIFDAQFIVIQRYNRPRAERIITKKLKLKEKLV